MHDVTKERFSGKTCTTSNGRLIVWNGHLCEGANLTSARDDNFCLWTRCGSNDVPANKAREGRLDEVSCEACREKLNSSAIPRSTTVRRGGPPA